MPSNAAHGRVTLEAIIRAVRPLDEMSVARLIALAAEAIHKAQTGGQALGMISPAAIVVASNGATQLDLFAVSSTGHTAPGARSRPR